MKVLISVTRRTKYTSIVEMTEEEFQRLDKALDETSPRGFRNPNKAAEEECNQLIDVRDWLDDELDSLDAFEEFTEEKE